LDDIQNGTEPDGVTTTNTSLRLADIKPNPYQPREIFDEEKLQELADSIKEHGVFTPVLVRKVTDGYELVAGERRTKAAEIAGLTEIPAIIVDFNDDQMMEISLLENIQRENLSAIEEAKAYKNLIDKRGYTQEELGKRVSKSREHVANTLRLLSLPEKVQKLVENGILSAGQARPLITVDPKDVDKLVDKVVKENLSARRVEKLVQDYKNPVIKNTPVISEAAQEYQKQLRHYLQTRVKIDGTKITINYVDEDDLKRIIQSIINND
ncbi:MAG: ParB/RepB/Spo0J family partition protein, partial [Bacillus sp. (in: Bacteria)]|nr:ParB/RepB/Spo0J family partition protein [Oceanobacillus sp.]MBR3335518.1 ParB/RepB/Spo0J family partition protein [Bacillus sp. (in: firmicutes)]